MSGISLKRMETAAIDNNPDPTWREGTSTVMAEVATLDGHQWRLELASDIEKPGLGTEVEELARNSCDINPFYLPSFLLPAKDKIADQQLRFLCLYRCVSGMRELCLFTPVVIHKNTLLQKRILRAWVHPYGPLGVPFTNRVNSEEVLQGFAECLLVAGNRETDLLVFDNLPKNSVFSKTLFSMKPLADRLLRYAPHYRSGFKDLNQLQTSLDQIRGKRRQRLFAARKKLDGLGEVEYDRARSRERLEIALTEHLILENEGWKGRSGSAIINSRNIREFVEAIVEQMGERHECEIYSVKLNGKTISSLIMFTIDGHFFPWKIAYDEAYYAYSTGILLLSYVNKQLSEKDGFKSLDSLASSLNQTARRVWPHDREFISMAIALGENGARDVLRFARRDQWKNKAKLKIKKLLGHSF